MAYADTLRSELKELREKEAYFETVKNGMYWTWLALSERIFLLHESQQRQSRITKIEETLNRLDEGQVRLEDVRFS